MGLTIAIHQPNFFPRLKILQKLACADMWVIMDNVQYNKQDYQNRTKIYPLNDSAEFWLTLPTYCPEGSKTLIKNVEVFDKYFYSVNNILEDAFNSAPYWDDFKHFVELPKTKSLVKIDVATTMKLLKLARKIPEIVYLSDLPIYEKKSRLVAKICEYLRADSYLCGSGGLNYLNKDDFKATKVLVQNWEEPSNKISSWRNLSSINYLVREGKNKFIDHITSGSFKVI